MKQATVKNSGDKELKERLVKKASTLTDEECQLVLERISASSKNQSK